MIIRYLTYTILLITISAIGYCQDLIIKKDSSKIDAMIYKIEVQEIFYSIYYSAKETIFRIPKKDVSKVIFRNGTEILFDTITNTKRKYDVMVYVEKKRKERPKRKPDTLEINDYIKLNLQAAIVVYNSFSNVPRRNYLAMTSFDEYLPISNQQNATLNTGFNFLFGASPYVKHIIGVNYIRTKCEYYYNYGSIGFSSHAKYKSEVDFVNITTGLRFTIFKKLHIEPLLNLSYVVNSKTTRTGTETSFDSRTPPYTRTTRSFENEQSNPSVGTTVSLAPKISYELPVRKIKIEVYISYNLALRYSLPWCQFGIHVFPFKKLR